MAMRLVFTETYNRSVDEIFSCAETVYSIATLKKFHLALKKKKDYLLANPLLGSIETSLADCEYEYRYLVIKPYFKIIYRVEGDTIFFVRMWDVRRDPNLLTRNFI